MAVILTTIQPPTDCVLDLASKVQPLGEQLIVVGDRKGPESYDIPGCHFLSIDDQKELPFRLARLLPENHYARKNLGYLVACSKRAPVIYETDDDNAPTHNWTMRSPRVDARECTSSSWVNIYSSFTSELIWPRGLPLDRIHHPPELREDISSVVAPVQQGLVNGSPDVDAIWRFMFKTEFTFDDSPSVSLGPGTWSPFNSQSTWWWPEAYALLYLPSYCSFRMTDIWRSFVAQRCLWLHGYSVVYHCPEAYQIRNPHRLMKDFSDEIVGYTRNHEIADILMSAPLDKEESLAQNLSKCYLSLVAQGLFPEKEMSLVEAWVSDVASFLE